MDAGGHRPVGRLRIPPGQPVGVEALLAPGHEGVVEGLEADPRPAGVVQLQRLERRPGVGEALRVAGRLEGRHRDVVGADVVGVGVAAVVVAVGDDHLGPLGPDDPHQLLHRLLEGRLGERPRVGVGLGARHAGVAVAEQVGRPVAEDPRRLVELGEADGPEVGPHLGRVGGGVEDVALGAVGAGHEHGVDALGGVAGVGAGALGGLVVGMGVDLEEAEPVVGHCLHNGTGGLPHSRPAGTSSHSPVSSSSTRRKPHSSASRARPSSGPLAMSSSPASRRTRPRGR